MNIHTAFSWIIMLEWFETYHCHSPCLVHKALFLYKQKEQTNKYIHFNAGLAKISPGQPSDKYRRKRLPLWCAFPTLVLALFHTWLTSSTNNSLFFSWEVNHCECRLNHILIQLFVIFAVLTCYCFLLLSQRSSVVFMLFVLFWVFCSVTLFKGSCVICAINVFCVVVE